jgi:hypothetical protein
MMTINPVMESKNLSEQSIFHTGEKDVLDEDN